MSIRDAIRAVAGGRGLSEDDAASVAGEIIGGRATVSQIAGLLAALRTRGESVDEIVGFTRAIRAAATPLPGVAATDVIDTCGSGGDGLNTFNISTVAALVAAGAGCKVAKHGNHSNEGGSGSADALLSLGVNIQMSPEQTARCILEIGVGFLYAPQYHPGARHAREPRRELGIRTIFNAVGPLSNPAGAKRQLLGIYDARLTEPLAQVLRRLGSAHCLIVHGDDGLDELTTTTTSRVTELKGESIRTYSLAPEDCGVPRGQAGDLAGGDPTYNANITREILRGEPGPRREVVVLNAAAAVYVAGLAASIAEGVEHARQSIDSGQAAAALDQLITRSKAI